MRHGLRRGEEDAEALDDPLGHLGIVGLAVGRDSDLGRLVFPALVEVGVPAGVGLGDAGPNIVFGEFPSVLFADPLRAYEHTVNLFVRNTASHGVSSVLF